MPEYSVAPSMKTIETEKVTSAVTSSLFEIHRLFCVFDLVAIANPIENAVTIGSKMAC